MISLSRKSRNQIMRFY